MKRWACVATWGLLLWGTSGTMAAAAPSDAAADAYYVCYPQALLAFRVDPWSQDVHRIQGIGRSTIGDGDDATDLYFEICGLYRPGMAHTAEGLFLFHHENSIQQIPWKALYDREKKSFTWAVVVHGELKTLLPAIAPTAEVRAALEAGRKKQAAAASPDAPKTSWTTPSHFASPFRLSSYQKDPPSSPTYPYDLRGEKASIDFGRVLIRALDEVPTPQNVAPSTQPPTATPSATPSAAATAEERSNFTILDSLTNIGKTDIAGETQNVKQLLEDRLDHDFGVSPKAGRNIRKRVDYPMPDQERILQKLVLPKSGGFANPKGDFKVWDVPPPSYPPRDKPVAIDERLVPSVVGLSLENAVTALWAAGLNPNSVECLGESTEPTQADRVTKQIPAAGSVYPPNGKMTLQWYSKPTGASVLTPAQAVETKPAEPAPTEPAAPVKSVVGFQPGDGGKVEGRFGGAEIYADGKGIAFASGGAGGGMNWLIGKLDEPLFQVGIAAAKESVQRLSQTRSSGKAVVTIAQSSAGVIDLSINNGDGSGGSTYCYQYQEYRGFFINYAEMVNTPGAALGAKAAAGIEKSKQLIDLRFPK